MPSVLPRHRLMVVIGILVGLALCVWLAGLLAERRAWSQRSEEAAAQLELYAQSVHTLVERFRSVPALLAQDGAIRDLLNAPGDPLLRQAINRRLESLNGAAGSAVLYLLDSSGEAIAASNWREWSSFVGNNYAFRPYFQDAVREDSGRYFAVGVTTGVPGYFLSHAVKDASGQVLGVLVVKLELEELQREWVGQTDVLLVSDRHGVVILSNRPAWRFRQLRPLAEAQRLELEQARKFARQNLQPLPSTTLRQISALAEQRRVEGPDGRRDYLWQRRELNDEGWTLHLLVEPAAVAGVVRSYRLAAAGLWTTAVFLLLWLLQRRKTQRLQQRSREELERLVEERTAALRTAQDELVQAAKLAALGQMSAALAHELNQPLTAMQMQLGSLRLLLEQDRVEPARVGVQRIEGLLQRMAGLTGHLKTFARKSPGGLRERLELGQVLDQALQLLAPRMRAEGVEITREQAEPAWVLGDAIRLEQVLLNLLHNALDAMAECAQRQLRLRIEREGEAWRLDVEDSGAGIAEEHLTHLFEPFFTTKPVGEGLGLGLAVSYGIVHELGGSLTARNGEAGAIFSLRLAAA
ncbi:ATP-binding protein [Pseudomonas sp. GOM6]|uniref:sensor histidine kinase n=1 Tax=Pseudomonas sp. GOM6 TaxID=3036944 RepID=UPI0024094BC5|nr:ATP-binding protein [Pseudomonas sp. GOM6]MDG1583149.1 ATP-binding protein [Pseudomonas sp. GOM6]